MESVCEFVDVAVKVLHNCNGEVIETFIASSVQSNTVNIVPSER